MRIISGTARGTKLYTLEGNLTRPTLDRVKESIFNIIQTSIKGSNFLDLFSGSGAIGLEAASRGAKKVIMCDKSKEAIKIIKKNIEKTHLEKIVSVYNMNYKECLEKLKNEKFDYIYLDPPYKTDLVIKSIKYIQEYKLLNDKAVIIVETNEQDVIEKIKEENVQIIDTRKYGSVTVLFLQYNIC